MHGGRFLLLLFESREVRQYVKKVSRPPKAVSGSLNILDTDYMLEGSRCHDTYLYVETVIYGIVAMMCFN